MTDGAGNPSVVAVSVAARHGFSKANCLSIRLLAGLGVAGDAHCGATVKHRHHAAKDPTAPNLRQVHLIQEELFPELAAKGFPLGPGALGENVTTRGIDLLALPAGTRLGLGAEAVVELTGLRNPCRQMEGLCEGLMQATLDRGPDGALIRKAGVMAIVLTGGDVRPGDPVSVTLPSGPPRPLAVV